MTQSTNSAYAASGVDIDRMMGALSAAKRRIKKTATKGVVSEVGNFGGMYKSPGDKSLLVSSIDGVGTKLKVAHMAGVHDSIGQCLVNHCVNDILTQGATPLFFMDYLGAAALEAEVFSQVVDGLCIACKENGCALIGGETAEMPGLYPDGEYDLVGAIVGTVKEKDVITGKRIRDGDVLIGLPSSGLHTNGYSLARRVIFEQAGLHCDDVMPGTTRRVDNILLAVHRSYLHPIRKVRKKVKIRGLAHVTGGGLVDNLPRILPKGLYAEVDRTAWKIPPVFNFIAHSGQVDAQEMYRVFNMGIGMVAVVRPSDMDTTLTILRKCSEDPVVIGVVKPGRTRVKLVNDQS